MNLSDRCIEMCRKAGEIQTLWKHSRRSSGDWYFHEALDGCYVASDIEQDDKDCVWLPRQDQIQKLLEYENILELESDFAVWVDTTYVEDFNPEDYNSFDKTMEELWLLFFMDKIHNRSWDDENKIWITN